MRADDVGWVRFFELLCVHFFNQEKTDRGRHDVFRFSPRKIAAVEDTAELQKRSSKCFIHKKMQFATMIRVEFAGFFCRNAIDALPDLKPQACLNNFF